MRKPTKQTKEQKAAAKAKAEKEREERRQSRSAQEFVDRVALVQLKGELEKAERDFLTLPQSYTRFKIEFLRARIARFTEDHKHQQTRTLELLQQAIEEVLRYCDPLSCSVVSLTLKVQSPFTSTERTGTIRLSRQL